ncbi:hypothetical protein [Pseudogemmobacter humi]|uniref:Uncharacterized protein n=1 Tax=Pseudogemmobacter humi TaxID=2483812 RepID=A0A3P5X9R5_9RHOB|nr:hypothetical protein [Pseudogemmobacter humi]VDC25109.1 hypothetical protein XINFAN_01385 [Pseudogemmobacter humi]
MQTENLIASLEGRLIAHRKLLARLLSASPEAVRAEIGTWLTGREMLSDGQEDPGAVPADGLALELALSDELHEIAAIADLSQDRPDPV